MKIYGLVQARMGSQRLPGKVMKPLAGIPLVGHIFRRLEATTGLAGIVLATTVDARNDPMIAYAESCGVAVYRSPREDDIADRLAGAARTVNADAILKVNADCPMIDPAVLTLIVDRFLAADGADYASNKIEWRWPEGMSAEVIGRAALEWCDANLRSDEDREFTANWIRDHTDRFKVVSVVGEHDYTHFKWSVDTPEDFAEAEAIFGALHGRNPLFGMDDILAYTGQP